MELVNDTPFVAGQLRQERTPAEIHGTLLVKSTFEQHGARWAPATEQVPLVGVQLETPFGVFHSEYFVAKEGVDVCVLGTVKPGGALRSTEVAIELGPHRRELRVFGDRRWLKRGVALRPSDPEFFEEMPLSYAHAYGGVTEHDYETAAYADNPIGRGYYLSAAGAENGLLPNIEHNDAARIESWEQTVAVAGWAPYPRTWGIRAREGIDVQDDFLRNPIPLPPRPRLYNNAHSTLIFPSFADDSVISLHGMRAAQLSFELPRLELVAEIVVGRNRGQARGVLDGIHLWVDANRITLTHRLHYVYEYRKGERRQIRLLRANAKGRG